MSDAARRCRAGLALLGSLGLLAGCGGSDTDGTGTAGPGSAREPSSPPRVVVETATGGFDPARVYRQAAPGVVTVRSVFEGGGGLLDGASAAEGSGFVLNSDGEVVTNAHVVTDGVGTDRQVADQVIVEFSDRNIVAAEVIGFDPFYDVALLKVEPGDLDLRPLELGDDSKLVVGQPVAAIGSPFSEDQSLSVGIVSATDRSVRSLTQFRIEGAIQTDASINPGNSGGPLLDAAARVIGINQQIETRSGANDGVGFAVPTSAIERSIAQLREKGEAEYAYIGVSSQALYPQLGERLDLDSDFGGLIAEIVPDGPAEKAGLQGGEQKIRFQAGEFTTGGDVILSVDGSKVVEPDDLARLISDFEPADRVTLEILRDGERRDVEVTLGVRPATIANG